jgi:hypothetical protein
MKKRKTKKGKSGKKRTRKPKAIPSELSLKLMGFHSLLIESSDIFAEDKW